jgi:two-component system cell cycle response regulator
MVGDRERVMAAGFDGYIAKPIEPETFVPQIEGWLQPSSRSSTPLQPSATADHPEQQARAGGVILAVDNVSANLELLRSLFQPIGYTVNTASTVSYALHMLHENSCDIIISDLHMPDVDGYKFMEIVRNNPEWRSIPFVILSSTSWGRSDAQRALELGAARFITRPIEPDKLLAEIENCLRQTRTETL